MILKRGALLTRNVVDTSSYLDLRLHCIVGYMVVWSHIKVYFINLRGNSRHRHTCVGCLWRLHPYPLCDMILSCNEFTEGLLDVKQFVVAK